MEKLARFCRRPDCAFRPGSEAVFRWANRVSEKLEENRMLVTEKAFGFLIAAIAVQLILDGLVSAGVIGPVPH
jgi:hypothetical protein